MKKLFRFLLLQIFLAPLALAQFTLVSGTVVDPNGIPYANGTITAQLILAGVTPTLNGGSFAMTGSAGLNSAGSFSMQLVSNSSMVPNTLQWSFTVCSAGGTVLPSGGTGPQCFTPARITITGATQSISTQLNAAALALTAGGALGFLQVTGTISSAQILALHTTPVVVIPAPGPGLFIDVDSIEFNTITGGTAYAGNNTLFLNNTTVYTYFSIPQSSSGLNFNGNSWARWQEQSLGTTLAGGSASAVNQPVSINASGNPTTGNGSFRYIIRYRIISLQ